MADDVQFQSAAIASPPAATIVETIDEGAGIQRQVVAIGSIGKSGSETQVSGALPVNATQLAGVAPATETDSGAAVLQVSLTNMTSHLRAILNALVKSPSMDPTGRVRISLDSATNLGASPLAVNLGGESTLYMASNLMRTAWANATRAHIT